MYTAETWTLPKVDQILGKFRNVVLKKVVDQLDRPCEE